MAFDPVSLAISAAVKIGGSMLTGGKKSSSSSAYSAEQQRYDKAESALGILRTARSKVGVTKNTKAGFLGPQRPQFPREEPNPVEAMVSKILATGDVNGRKFLEDINYTNLQIEGKNELTGGDDILKKFGKGSYDPGSIPVTSSELS